MSPASPAKWPPGPKAPRGFRTPARPLARLAAPATSSLAQIAHVSIAAARTDLRFGQVEPTTYAALRVESPSLAEPQRRVGPFSTFAGRRGGSLVAPGWCAPVGTNERRVWRGSLSGPRLRRQTAGLDSAAVPNRWGGLCGGGGEAASDREARARAGKLDGDAGARDVARGGGPG